MLEIPSAKHFSDEFFIVAGARQPGSVEIIPRRTLQIIGSRQQQNRVE